MFKNVVLKKVLKNSIFKLASIVNKVIPKDDKIVLLYSANKGISHSLIPLREYLLKENFDSRYKIYCGIENLKYKDDVDLEFLSTIQSYKKFFKAKYVFYSVGQIPIKPSKSQCVIHMQHGNADFKTMGINTNINNGDEFFFTYMIAPSPLFVPIMAQEYQCSEENIKVAGEPLIDDILNAPVDEYNFNKYNKVILWLPTFRQSDYLGYDDSTEEGLVPLIKEEDYLKFNEFLGKYNIKLIVKIHPSQKEKGSLQRHFEYLDIFTDEEFIQSGYKLSLLMARCDALIGDYSSASMQYYVLNRPQAFVIPDYDEYSQRRGFIFDNAKEYMAGHIITSYDEFKMFIVDMANNNDVYKEKREVVRKKVYTYFDNKNCERIVKLSGMKMY